MFVTVVSGIGTATPTGPAGGDLAGTYPNPTVIALEETSTPARLALAAIPDQTFLQRVGLTVVGTDPNTVVKGPWSSVLYVDNVRGSDATGTRGNANRPFATIQAALNAMSTDDLALLGPQVFALATPLTVPATVIRGACYGLTQGNSTGVSTLQSISGKTVLTPTAAGTLTAQWDLGANLGLNLFVIGCMELGFNSSGFSPTVANIKADGSAYAVGAFLGGGLYLDAVTCFDSAPDQLLFKYVGSFKASACFFGGSRMTIANCGAAEMSMCRAASSKLLMSSDATDALTPSQLRLRLVNGTVVGGDPTGVGAAVTFGPGQPQLQVDQTSLIGGLVGLNLSRNAAPARSPQVTCCGYVAGGVASLDFASAGAELPDTATALVFDFRGARFYGSSAVSFNANMLSGPTSVKFKVGGAAGNFQAVKLDDSVALPATTFTADSKIHMTCRGAVQPQAVYTTPGTTTVDGDIIPPMLTGTIDLHLGGAVAFTWVDLGYPGLIRTGAACDTAFLTESAAASDPFIAAKATTGLTITSAVVAGDTACNWLAIWK